ncbi:MAG: ABC transporter ATP-binding protein [Deltaproteobacteria bacterium]|nr:ABC transporter ATP-binding protein [Deltaproteobacteria bacterium]
MSAGDGVEKDLPVVEMSGVGKRFGAFAAVKGVTFSAQRGDIIGLLGINGAGKTTTLRMLATYLIPTSGSICISGFDTVKEGEEVRRRIGYLPETPPLYDEMTVLEYLAFVASAREIKKTERKDAVESILERCGLVEVRHRLCRHLSRGYRQRAGLAQAIIHAPEVIILDEPTGGLDPQQVIQIRRLILSLAHDRVLILSTHILPEVTMVCNRVLIMHAGSLVLDQGLAQLTDEQSLEKAFLRCIGTDVEAVSA